MRVCQFIANEDFEDYVARKRSDACFGNHPELQAFAELYCRKIEVYDSAQPQAAPQDYMWHMPEGGAVGEGGGAAGEVGGGGGPSAPPARPLRLSYHNGNHYNSIEDLDHSNFLDALGVPGQSGRAGGVEKENVDSAMARSEQELLEKEMLASSMAASTEEAAAAEEARVLELALKDSVEESMRGAGGAAGGAAAGGGGGGPGGEQGQQARVAQDIETLVRPNRMPPLPTSDPAAFQSEVLLTGCGLQVGMGFARDDVEVAYAMFDCNLDSCATYLLQERERMAAADMGDFY